MVVRRILICQRAVVLDFLGVDQPGAISIAWKKTAGANIVYTDDNVYIDISAAFTIAIAGRSHPTIADAVGAQARELMHAPARMSSNTQRVELLEKLADLLSDDLKSIHLGSIGSEAIDVGMFCTGLDPSSSTRRGVS